MAFDVETTMKVDPPYVPSDNAKLAIKSINLMCFLLDDVTYNELYVEDFRLALRRIITRAQNLDQVPTLPSLNQGAHDPNTPIKDWIVRALEDIERILTKPLFLGDLFHTTFGPPILPAPASQEYQVWNRFRQMYNDASVGGPNELTHFCCPVVYFQENPGALLKRRQLESFLDDFGDMTMYELFTKQRKRLTEAQLNKLQAARDAKILTDATVKLAAGNVGMLNFPASNELQCNYTTSTCYSHPHFECFCNDANGSCSAMSYP